MIFAATRNTGEYTIRSSAHNFDGGQLYNKFECSADDEDKICPKLGAVKNAAKWYEFA